ncbi:MAG TPA: hypothetical protein VM451_05670 [Candidatus Limnocylindria bacterium]|nr:hypothetical protein [Candidatus Limnocylindria bacterium]
MPPEPDSLAEAFDDLDPDESLAPPESSFAPLPDGASVPGDPFDFDDPSPELSPSPDEAALDARVRLLLALDRSFFAQPEPLKWTVGATNAFRSVSSAPQAGQNRGAGASMPWMNSVRVEQVEQT